MQQREELTLSQATERSGYSHTQLLRLVTNNLIEARRIGRFWIVYADSLMDYASKPHKGGPRGPTGPRKPRKREDNTDVE